MELTDAAERVGLAVVAAAGLWLVGQGMVDVFQLSLTEEALVEIRRGRLLVWAPAAVAVATPVVLGALLVLVAEETLLPQLAVLVTLPVGIGGVLGLLLVRSRGRAPAAPTRS